VAAFAGNDIGLARAEELGIGLAGICHRHTYCRSLWRYAILVW
jgi:hypothetical protein